MGAPRRACTCLFILLVLRCCLLCRAAAQSRRAGEAEAELLLQMKRAWGDPPSLAAWSAATSAAGAHCGWPYVDCDTAGHVIRLYLGSTNITGSISEAIGGLSKLAHLDLSNNSIAGTFPTALYYCSSLQYLDMSFNHIVGELPYDIGYDLSADLIMLDLGYNKFNGSIPSSLSRLRNLQYLILDNNHLTGTIPASLSRLQNLWSVSLDNNHLTGTIPEGLCSGGPLVYYASSNRLKGSIPVDLANCATLEVLDLTGNQLSGEVPYALWTTARRQFGLRVLLRNNRLTGSLPAIMSSDLVVVDIGNNQFVGRVPMVAVGLFSFVADNNQFSGEIPINLGHGMPQLRRLNLANNKLSGMIR